MRTNDYGIYVDIPNSPFTNMTSPFTFHEPPTIFIPTTPDNYKQIMLVTSIFCIYFDYYHKYIQFIINQFIVI